MDDELENYMLVCGNIQEIQSVFVNRADYSDDSSQDEQEVRRLNGSLIPLKYLVPLELFLDNSIF